MSYCRFGRCCDVYLFLHVGGHIECCGCRLADPVKSIFTDGWDEHPLFDGPAGPCPDCEGEGCDGCMMAGSTQLYSFEEAIAHLEEHRANGDEFPEYAIERLRKEQDEHGTLESLFRDR